MPPTVDMPVVGNTRRPVLCPRRVAYHRLKVTFNIGANESMNVYDQDKSTDRSNQIIIANENETDHVAQEAEEYRDENEDNKMNVDSKNGLMNHCVAMRNTFIDERHEDNC